DLQYYEDSEGTPVTMTSPTAKVICKDTAVLEQERTATQYKVTFKDKSEGEKLGLNVLPTGNEFTVTPEATGELPLKITVTDLYDDSLILCEETINIPVHHYAVDNNITIEDVEDPGVEVLPTDLVTNKKYKTSAIKITDAITTPATEVSEDKIANWNVNAAGSLITDVKTVTETNAQGELETHIEFNTNPLASGNEPIEIGATLITGTEISPITIDCTVTQGVITYGITGIQYFEDEEGNRTAYDPTKFPKLNQNTTYVTNWFNLTANGVPLSVEDIANVSIILNRNALDVRMTIPRNPGTNEYRLKFTPVKEREETAFSSQYQWSYMYGDSVVYQSGVLRIYYYKQS
ncbi:MAG: hypothetical protein HUJ52_02860, partial [Malacoplasma sp.]|nr:hypothetical protein [Malacoplasma sp.]